MNEVFETIAEVFEELRSESGEREYSVQTKESEKADKKLKKANREYEKLLTEISAEHKEFLEDYMDIVDHAHYEEQQLKVPLTEVQEDLKKLRDIRYLVRKATPGTEESKEPPKKQPLKEVLQDKADEKKAQKNAPAQTKHKQQDMEL